MKSSRSVEYTSNQFTMADLRQIVKENESVADAERVSLEVSKPFPGEYGATSYSIEIG